MLKEIVARGIYYNSIGMKEYELWTKTIVNDYGPDIKQYIRDIRKWSLLLPLSDRYGTVKKINCWEFMGCAFQPDVELAKEETVCPAFKNGGLNGIHGGRNAGRACWVVPYTQCFGTTQGTCEQKYSSCRLCDFYQTVFEEEKKFFTTEKLKSML